LILVSLVPFLEVVEGLLVDGGLGIVKTILVKFSTKTSEFIVDCRVVLRFEDLEGLLLLIIEGIEGLLLLIIEDLEGLLLLIIEGVEGLLLVATEGVEGLLLLIIEGVEGLLLLTTEGVEGLLSIIEDEDIIFEPSVFTKVICKIMKTICIII
jgi:hypothetical protein